MRRDDFATEMRPSHTYAQRRDRRWPTTTERATAPASGYYPSAGFAEAANLEQLCTRGCTCWLRLANYYGDISWR